jgi:cell pole-organizing protein PopZ
MSQAAKAQEPSMEEILASIRRIIADDDPAKPAAAKPAAAPPAAPRPAAMPPRHPVPPSPVAAPPPRQAASPPPPVGEAPVMDQRSIDAMLAGLDAPPGGISPPTDDVLDLTEQMTAPADAETPSFQTIDGQSDVIFTDPPAAQEPPLRAEEPRRQHAAPPQASALERTIMSSSTSAAVDSAFNALAQTVLVQNARTLEDLVREMLRPLLKSWLDDNLPGMVERIIKAEIERVSRGRS